MTISDRSVDRISRFVILPLVYVWAVLSLPGELLDEGLAKFAATRGGRVFTRVYDALIGAPSRFFVYAFILLFWYAFIVTYTFVTAPREMSTEIRRPHVEARAPAGPPSARVGR